MYVDVCRCIYVCVYMYECDGWTSSCMYVAYQEL